MRSSIVLAVALFLFAGGMVLGQTLPAAGGAGFSEADYAAHVKALREKLPAGFTVLVQKPFVVIGDDTPAMVKSSAERTVKWAVERLKKEYFAKDPAEILDVYLFKDKASYDRYTKELFHDTPDTPYGYFSPAHQALIMNIATGGGTLVHEIVHPFVAANFPKCPTWFNEGLGSLYEQSNERDGRIIGMPNWRLAGLQEELKNKTAPGFKELCAMDAATFYGANRGINYSTARYLLLYLQERGLLQKYYKAFVAGQQKDPTGFETLQAMLKGAGEGDSEAFRRKWEVWVMGLKFP